MLSLSLLAARARLLRGPAASRCVSAVARSVGNNVAVVSAPSARFETTKSRLFSTIDGPKDEDEDKQDREVDGEQDQPIDDGLSPLERLMQHSQQFRVDMDLEDDEEFNAGHGQDDDGDDKAQDEQDDEVFASSWQDEAPSSSKKKPSGDASGSTRPPFKRNTFRRRGSSDRQSQLGKMAVNRLLQKDMDELNYDAELENVWGEQELKQRKFHQHLRREQDRDHVCQNCGERGHRSRNCLVPRICSNCGNLGHSANQCRYRKSPDSIDEFLEAEEDFQKRQKKTRKFRKKAAIAAKNPQAPRPKGMPMSDYNKRNEVMREELESEIDAYADFLEEKDRQRKEQQRLKEAQDGKPNDAD